jgi:hypothetical protein
MTHAADLCSPCERPSPTARSLLKPFLNRLLAVIPRRRDTIDPERLPRYLLRDIGLSD